MAHNHPEHWDHGMQGVYDPDGPVPAPVDPLIAIAENLRHILETERANSRMLKQILQLLQPKIAVSAKLTLVTATGELMADLTAHVNDAPGQAVFAEFDGPSGLGNKVPAIGPVAFASSDPTIAAVDPNTGQLAYMKPGVATISGNDAGNNQAAKAQLTLLAGTAQSATLDLVPGPTAGQATRRL